MNRFRPLLSAVLGLVLLVQGFAVAAAEYRLPETSQMAAGVIQKDLMSPALVTAGNPRGTPGAAAEQSLPCHMQATQDESVPACCGGDCSNMTTCALGHLASAPVAALDSVTAAEPVLVEPVLPRSASSPQTLLRPPIALHA